MHTMTILLFSDTLDSMTILLFSETLGTMSILLNLPDTGYNETIIKSPRHWVQ